jgi:F0F1-type ATP synthase assembly protein I
MKSQVIKILIIQYTVGVVYLLGVGLLTTEQWNKESILSAFVGCMAGLVPNTYICMKMLKRQDSEDATQWLGFAYRSEFGKWLMTGMIFAIAFTTGLVWDPIILFTGFCLILISGGIAPLITKG